MEDENDDGAAIGFMFDDAASKRWSRFQITPEIEVDVLNNEEEEPGALQSGHYIWPASPALARYLVNQHQKGELIDTSSSSSSNAFAVMELGAGCSLIGLTLAQLPGCSLVTMTDHDPGTLKLIKESIGKNQARLTARCEVLALEWGDTSPPSASADKKGGVDLLVGSDLIYSEGVVAPLLKTVASYLSARSKFIIGGSFALSPETEEIIDQTCKELGLVRKVLDSDSNEEEKAEDEEGGLLWLNCFHCSKGPI